MIKRDFLFFLGFAFFISCGKIKTSTETRHATDTTTTPIPNDSCVQVSADEMLNIYDRSSPGELQNTMICFEGYVLSEYSTNELPQADIAFKPITPGTSGIPNIYCQFTGENGDPIRNKKPGDKVSVKGRIQSLENPRLHNLIMVKCEVQ